MSLTPETPLPPPMPPELPTAEVPVHAPMRPRRTWQNKLLTVCVAIFTFEVGLFLVLFPWMEETWKVNYFRGLSPGLQDLWDQPAFRGALTGLGLVNLWLAVRQAFGLLRR